MRGKWVHDPSDLVPSTALDPFSLLREWADERPAQQRADVLTFTSEPLAEPLDLAGPVSAQLTLESTCSSMHVYVKLCDVFPGWGGPHAGARRGPASGERLQAAGGDRHEPHRLSVTAWSLSTSLSRLKRLPSICLASRHRGEPLAGHT